MKFDTYSLSRLRKFEECAFSGFGHYIKKIRPERTPANFAFGHAVEGALNGGLVHGCDLEKGIQAAETIYSEELPEPREGEEEDKFQRVKEGVEIAFDELLPKLKEHWTGDPEDIQRQFYVPVGDFEFTGILDIVGKDGYLIDIKTAWKSWPKGKELTEEQAITYPLWAFSQDLDLEKCTFAYYIVVMNKKPKTDIREVTVTREETFNYLKLIESRATIIDYQLGRYIDSGDPKVFPANRQSWTCSRKNCPSWELCEETWNWKIKE